jgi:hypothetical protein
MSYKSLKGKWQVAGDKPTITLLPAGLFCFNKVCYELFVLPSNAKYVKLYYDPEMKKIAFELLTAKAGEQVFPISLTKTGLVAVVNARKFLEHFGIKYAGKPLSYPVHQTIMAKPGSGYKRTWREVRLEVLEIRLDEYITD